MMNVNKLKNKISFALKVNWVKTLYFNFKKFPFNIAVKLPVVFYGRVKFKSINGEIIFNTPVKRAMIGFGEPYEMNTVSIGLAEIMIEGKVIFNGKVQFGKDNFLYVKKDGVLVMGNMSSIGSRGKIICTDSITFGDFARIGSESQVIDTNFHEMTNTETNEIYNLTAPIVLGDYNFISNRVTILSKTRTPNYCTIASNSLCNKDYSVLGENVLIGGIPAKLLKKNVTRNWKAENL
jgi:acetyltransferase-like isoleucine patch superfamily enzyme